MNSAVKILVELPVGEGSVKLSPRITRMASGNLSLLLTEDVSWESFPGVALAVTKKLNARVIIRIETPVDRMWIVLIRWRPFFLTYDDFPNELTLDSMSRVCNSVVCELYEGLTGEPAGDWGSVK